MSNYETRCLKLAYFLEEPSILRQAYCLLRGTATCNHNPVNKNIFYIIGVIVVIVVVLKVLGLF